MREIKFKGYHKKKAKILEIKLLDFIKGLCYYVDGLGYSDTSLSNVALMQYTGLKDKNGKDIYEGDIIKYTTNYYGNLKQHINKVEWEEDLEHDGFGEPLAMGYIFRGYDIEVIGNIYENPNLLT